MSRPRGRSLLRYEDVSPEELELRIKKQQDYKEILLRQIEEKKLMKENEKLKKLEEDRKEEERIRRDIEDMEKRRLQSNMKRLRKSIQPGNIHLNQFDAVQVETNSDKSF